MKKPQQYYTPGSNKPPSALTIGPMDLLPQHAKLDPLYDQNKPAFASQQNPELAAKYGVIRNGVHYLPNGNTEITQQPPAPTPPTTSLSDMSPRQETPTIIQPSEEEKQKAEEEKKKELEEALRKEEEEAFSGIDADPPPGLADMAQAREKHIAAMLSSDEQRKLVESRLIGKFSISDFVLGRPIRQTHVVSDQLNFTFQAMTYREEMDIRGFIAEEAQAPVFDEYLLDKLVLLGLTCSIYAVNGDVWPDHRNAQGGVDAEKLKKKLNILLNMPVPLVSLLSIHFSWFHERMMKALKAMNLKNG